MIFSITKLWGFIGVFKKAHYRWEVAYRVYLSGNYQSSLWHYQKAWPLLKTNGDYLLHYGKALSMAKQHEKAIKILDYSKKYNNKSITYTALGDSYKATKRYNEAEKAYMHAWYMIPNRFYPKYLLAKLYESIGNKKKSLQIAKELLDKDIKIESKAVEEIKAEMNKIILMANEE